ncbi:hypothetical protein MP228_007801 [Amoeboaphelidium protococcarum]|nr:hypothetical protein MP228_007801 [Amoeboaphelidium protococcarum]
MTNSSIKTKLWHFILPLWTVIIMACVAIKVFCMCSFDWLRTLRSHEQDRSMPSGHCSETYIHHKRHPQWSFGQFVTINILEHVMRQDLDVIRCGTKLSHYLARFVHILPFVRIGLARIAVQSNVDAGDAAWTGIQMYWKKNGRDFGPLQRSNGNSDSVLPMHNRQVDEPEAVILFCHGGGFCAGTALQSFWALRNIMIQMKKRYKYTNIRIVCVEYDLAPEHTYPNALLQAYSAFNYFHRAGHKVIIMGDSAGGHLAYSVLIHDGILRDDHQMKSTDFAVSDSAQPVAPDSISRAAGILTISPSVHPFSFPRLLRYYSTNINYDFLHPIHLKAFSAAFISGKWIHPFSHGYYSKAIYGIFESFQSTEGEDATRADMESSREQVEVEIMLRDVPSPLKENINQVAPAMVDPQLMKRYLPPRSMIICGNGELLYPDIKRFHERINELSTPGDESIQVVSIAAGVHDYAMLVPGKDSKLAMDQGIEYIAKCLNLSSN